MNFLEFYQNLNYIYGEEIDPDDAEMAYQMAKKHGISVLSDKEIFCIVKDGDEVVGALWTAWNYDEFSFDVVVREDFQGKGVGKKLVDIAISEYNESNEAYDRGEGTIIRADVINPKMEQLLLKKGFEVESKQPGHTMMVRK